MTFPGSTKATDMFLTTEEYGVFPNLRVPLCLLSILCGFLTGWDCIDHKIR